MKNRKQSEHTKINDTHNIICQYCGNTFKTNTALNLHTRTAKYCLSTRYKTITDAHECAHCHKTFTQKITLDAHLKKCLVAAQNEQAEKFAAEKNILEEQIHILNNELTAKNKLYETQSKINKKKIYRLTAKNKELETKIAEIEKQLMYEQGFLAGYEKPKPPTSITNANTIINKKLQKIRCDTIPALTDDYIQSNLCDYSYDLFLKGPFGVVEFISKLIKKPTDDGAIEQNYVCTDISRNVGHRLIKSRDWEIDGGINFINDIFDALRQVQYNHWAKLSELASNGSDDREKQYSQEKLYELSEFHQGVVSPKGTKGREFSFNNVRTHIKQIAA
jgi:hypothetical protein